MKNKLSSFLTACGGEGTAWAGGGAPVFSKIVDGIYEWHIDNFLA